jgi:hypothetical protein
MHTIWYWYTCSYITEKLQRSTSALISFTIHLLEEINLFVMFNLKCLKLSQLNCNYKGERCDVFKTVI